MKSTWATASSFFYLICDYMSSWQVRANETLDEFEEGYDSSKDEISSVSSYNPNKGRLDLALRTSLSLQSFGSRAYAEGLRSEAENSNLRSYSTLPRLSVVTSTDDANIGKRFFRRQNQLLWFNPKLCLTSFCGNLEHSACFFTVVVFF